jgi:hypothetical protein
MIDCLNISKNRQASMGKTPYLFRKNHGRNATKGINLGRAPAVVFYCNIRCVAHLYALFF